MEQHPIRITLLTDFGTRDGYVAAMRGVIASIAPAVLIEDASHEIGPGDVQGAAWTLARYWKLYPEGTVHMAVVDPGVGTARRALAVRAEGRVLVAPDNGLLTRILAVTPAALVHEIREPAYMRMPLSATFHGRDVFAPAAAHLALGVPMERLGPRVTDPVTLRIPAAERVREGFLGEVVHVDRFGNLITNIPREWVGPDFTFGVRSATGIPFYEAYGNARHHELVALIGSADVAEISVRDGDAAARLGARRGDSVRVLPRG